MKLYFGTEGVLISSIGSKRHDDVNLNLVVDLYLWDVLKSLLLLMTHLKNYPI
jgi:hypothetical protein